MLFIGNIHSGTTYNPAWLLGVVISRFEKVWEKCVKKHFSGTWMGSVMRVGSGARLQITEVNILSGLHGTKDFCGMQNFQC